MKKMNKNLAERMNIASWDFYGPLRFTDLAVTDIDDHKLSVERVYRGMLREAGVVDDCSRRFEQMFKNRDIYIV